MLERRRDACRVQSSKAAIGLRAPPPGRARGRQISHTLTLAFQTQRQEKCTKTVACPRFAPPGRATVPRGSVRATALGLRSLRTGGLWSATAIKTLRKPTRARSRSRFLAYPSVVDVLIARGLMRWHHHPPDAGDGKLPSGAALRRRSCGQCRGLTPAESPRTIV